MFATSLFVNRILGSERSQMKVAVPKGAIGMSMGEPDFPTPVHIQEAATRAMKDNFTHYVDPQGDIELREAICYRYQKDYGINRPPEDVLITSGGITAINVLCGTFLNPGDEAVIMDPEYSGITEAVTLFGAKSIFVPMKEDLHLDFKGIEGKVTERTKMIFLSNPSNPTGQVLRKDEITFLSNLAEKYELMVAVDETYHKLVYEGVEYFSVCQVNKEQVRDRLVLINSFSKTYAMTGWRVGYLLADPKIINSVLSLHRALLTCVNAPAQKACVAALTGPQACVAEMMAAYALRRKMVAKALSKIALFSTPPCEAAFYFFPRFRHGYTSKEMVEYLASRGVLLRSGTEFGESGQKRVRLSFATSIEKLEEGLARLIQAMSDLE